MDGRGFETLDHGQSQDSSSDFPSKLQIDEHGILDILVVHNYLPAPRCFCCEY